MSTIKESLDLFLNSNYKNKLTKSTAKTAFKRIEHFEEIDIVKINELYESIPVEILSNSSKNTELAYIRKYIKKMSLIKNKFYDVSQLINFENDTLPKQTFTDSEIFLIRQQLEEFNNLEFKLIFELLLFNGCRIGEFCKVNWKQIHTTNYQQTLKSEKGGRFRIIKVPTHLINNFNQIGINYSYNTIQNLFKKFEIFLKANHPDFTKRITAHVLRTQLITNMHMCGIPVEKIQMVTGHAQINTITHYYIKSSTEYMNQILDLGNMTPIKSMEINKLNDYISTQNSEISFLKLKNEESFKIIEKLEEELKILKGNNENTKITNIQRIENEYQISSNKIESQDFWNMKAKMSNVIFKKFETMIKNK